MAGAHSGFYGRAAAEHVSTDVIGFEACNRIQDRTYKQRVAGKRRGTREETGGGATGFTCSRSLSASAAAEA